MPVLVPLRTSTDTRKAVRMLSVLVATIAGRSSSRARSVVMGAQMKPDVWARKKAIFSGVAASAAMIRSPSFSRSSSSTTTTISPRPMAATASSMRPNGVSATPGLQQLLDVLGHHIDLQVDPVARVLAAEGGDGRGVRDDGDGEPVVEDVDGREAHAVDGDGALL